MDVFVCTAKVTSNKALHCIALHCSARQGDASDQLGCRRTIQNNSAAMRPEKIFSHPSLHLKQTNGTNYVTQMGKILQVT